MNLKQLTPAQRAFILLVQTILISSFTTACVAVVPLFTGTQDIIWSRIGYVFALTLLVSVAHSTLTYLQSSQPDLATALAAILDALERRYEQKVESQQTQPMQAIHPPADSAK